MSKKPKRVVRTGDVCSSPATCMLCGVTLDELSEGLHRAEDGDTPSWHRMYLAENQKCLRQKNLLLEERKAHEALKVEHTKQREAYIRLADLYNGLTRAFDKNYVALLALRRAKEEDPIWGGPLGTPQCKVRGPKRWFCTRFKGHEGDHIDLERVARLNGVVGGLL